MTEWIKTTDRLPEKPGKAYYEHVGCLVRWHGETFIRPWNCEHLCWDDEGGDDFFAAPLDVTHWMPLPEPPEIIP
jgi:hypothetical protein